MTTTSYRSAAEIAEQLDRAAQAVRAYLGGTGEEREAAKQVWLAHQLDGTSPAHIAQRAGVRQLLVARLVDDDKLRAAALAAARHDAERYQAQVMDAIRVEALVRWRKANQDGDPPRGTKTLICTQLGLTRPTLDGWIAAEGERTRAR